VTHRYTQVDVEGNLKISAEVSRAMGFDPGSWVELGLLRPVDNCYKIVAPWLGIGEDAQEDLVPTFPLRRERSCPGDRW